MSILERAVYRRNLDILKLLLEDKRFDVNEKIIFGSYNDDDVWDEDKIKETKLSHKEEYDNSSRWSTIFYSKDVLSILHFAIDLNKIGAVQLLLENENIDVNAFSNEKGYEHTLKSSGGEKEVKKLEEKTPLYFAIEKGYYEIVKLLVNHKNIDINKKSIIYIWTNTISSDKEEDKKEEEEDRRDLIHKNEEEEEYLSENEGKFEQGVKEVDKEETVLHLAVSKGKIKIIKLLSQKSIDVNITDKQGRKPIELTHNEKILSLFNQLT